jgi:hypothetical protein
MVGHPVGDGPVDFVKICGERCTLQGMIHDKLPPNSSESMVKDESLLTLVRNITKNNIPNGLRGH